jgi:hypothetical protein
LFAPVALTTAPSLFASNAATGYDAPGVTAYALLLVIPQVPLTDSHGFVADVGSADVVLAATKVS